MAALNPKPVLALLLLFNLLLALSGLAFAGRITPATATNTDVKQPESFIGKDGSFLVPGIGRFILPGHGFNPFTYNPVTGTNGGQPSVGGSIGSGGGTGHSYVPGGDDTFVPNPGVEVPNPGTGGSTPGRARP
ncbi:putative cell wall protein [Diospyros lotus]|uniref:putative cell wall protein n=1 Tax=Diospyros lotus TaxID=55363 RepID=UPI0022545F81|nr:putative cell wall protein [Diospyros lotus]